MAATRFYWSGTNADINIGGPLTGGNLWESSITAANTTKKLRTATGSTANASNASSVGTGVNPNDVMFYQGISEPLAAQTIAGNVSAVTACRENTSINTNAFGQLGVFVINGSGVLVATLYGGKTAAGAQEFNNPSANNRILPNGTAAVAISSYACSAGDRICMEMGARLETTRSGDTVTMYTGDNNALDLPFANGTDNSLLKNAWLEFDSTLTFATLTAKRTAAYFMG